jgi:hypothetical protein
MFATERIGECDAGAELFRSNQKSRAINLPFTERIIVRRFHLTSALGGGRNFDLKFTGFCAAGFLIEWQEYTPEKLPLMVQTGGISRRASQGGAG